jgi:hypothetical protein
MKLNLTTILLLLSLPAFTQQTKIFRFGIMPTDSIEAIESKFISAIDSRQEAVCAFPDKEDKVLEQWSNLHQAFMKYLQEHGFIITENTKFFFRFYFNENGTVAYAGYRVITPAAEEFAEQLKTHLMNFASTFNFGLTANKPYVQCGSVTYQANIKETNKE